MLMMVPFFYFELYLVNICFSNAAWLQNASGGGNKLFSEGVPGRKVNWNVVKIKLFLNLIILDIKTTGKVHARVFQPLPHTGQPVELHSIDTSKTHTIDSELAYF